MTSPTVAVGRAEWNRPAGESPKDLVVEDLFAAESLQQIADSYLSWQKLEGYHVGVSEPTMETPFRFGVVVWHDYAPNETRANGYLDKRELLMLRGPQEVVRRVYGMVEGRVYECRDILEQIQPRDRGGYGEFALDFAASNTQGLDSRAAQFVQQVGPFDVPFIRREIERQRTAQEVPFRVPGFPMEALRPRKDATPPKPKPPGHSELTRELDLE